MRGMVLWYRPVFKMVEIRMSLGIREGGKRHWVERSTVDLNAAREPFCVP